MLPWSCVAHTVFSLLEDPKPGEEQQREIGERELEEILCAGCPVESK